MNQHLEGIMNIYYQSQTGFQAILDTLDDHIKDALQNILGKQNQVWVETRNALGIYAITRRRKAPSRLEKKIKDFSTKGIDLTPETFYKTIPDIVGARVICLHPDYLLRVALGLKKLGESSRYRNPPKPLKKLRVRFGSFSLLNAEAFKKNGFKVDEPHEAGYSSIHFVFRLGKDFERDIDHRRRDDIMRLASVGIVKEECLVEIQLRTILEEAWGEMDHWIRYEDDELASDPELKYQFSAMAGYIQAGNRHISLIKNIATKKINARLKK